MLVRKVMVPLLGLRLYELAPAVAVPGEATRLNTCEDIILGRYEVRM